MIELVFIIVVIGILASASISQLNRDLRQEAINSIISSLRQTQQLALNDSKHDFDDPQWQKSYWKWRYTVCQKGDIFYIVTSNTDNRTNADRIESAIDSSNHKYLYQSNYICRENAKENILDSSNVLLTKRFAIVSIINQGGCKGFQHVAFDNLGRPHSGIDGYTRPTYEFLLKDDCRFTFNFKKDGFFTSNIKPFTIIIEAITGRVSIERKND
jgi:type II secretory pathway pseudopilin PulG